MSSLGAILSTKNSARVILSKRGRGRVPFGFGSLNSPISHKNKSQPARQGCCLSKKIPLHLLQLQAPSLRTKNNTKIIKMQLEDVPLTDPMDQIQLSATRETFATLVRSGKAPGGVIRSGVNLAGGAIFQVETHGEKEFILFHVFLHKIRRDDRDLLKATTAQKRAWYDMAKQFVDEFKERTPPDVIKELQAVKEILGL